MGTFPRHSSSLPAMGRAGRDYLPSQYRSCWTGKFGGDESMPHAITTSTKTKKRDHLALFSTGLIILALLVAACGGASTGTTTSSASNGPSAGPAQQVQHSANVNSSTSLPGTPAATSKSSTTPSAAQYLIKSLAVNMEVKDTRRVAADLQAWIST